MRGVSLRTTIISKPPLSPKFPLTIRLSTFNITHAEYLKRPVYIHLLQNSNTPTFFCPIFSLSPFFSLTSYYYHHIICAFYIDFIGFVLCMLQLGLFTYALLIFCQIKHILYAITISEQIQFLWSDSFHLKRTLLAFHIQNQSNNHLCLTNTSFTTQMSLKADNSIPRSFWINWLRSCSSCFSILRIDAHSSNALSNLSCFLFLLRGSNIFNFFNNTNFVQTTSLCDQSYWPGLPCLFWFTTNIQSCDSNLKMTIHTRIAIPKMVWEALTSLQLEESFHHSFSNNLMFPKMKLRSKFLWKSLFLCTEQLLDISGYFSFSLNSFLTFWITHL